MEYFNNAKENFGVGADVGDALFGQDDATIFLGMVSGLSKEEEKALVEEFYETEWLVDEEETP